MRLKYDYLEWVSALFQIPSSTKKYVCNKSFNVRKLFILKRFSVIKGNLKHNIILPKNFPKLYMIRGSSSYFVQSEAY